MSATKYLSCKEVAFKLAKFPKTIEHWGRFGVYGFPRGVKLKRMGYWGWYWTEDSINHWLWKRRMAFHRRIPKRTWYVTVK